MNEPPGLSRLKLWGWLLPPPSCLAAHIPAPAVGRVPVLGDGTRLLSCLQHHCLSDWLWDPLHRGELQLSHGPHARSVPGKDSRRGPGLPATFFAFLTLMGNSSRTPRGCKGMLFWEDCYLMPKLLEGGWKPPVWQPRQHPGVQKRSGVWRTFLPTFNMFANCLLVFPPRVQCPDTWMLTILTSWCGTRSNVQMVIAFLQMFPFLHPNV